MKRHGFRGLRATHGVKRMHRHPGSSGPSADPARTQKGIRKPGHIGHAQVTVRNLKVVQIDPTNNLLLIKGAVPGPQRRLPHHPADKQGLKTRAAPDQGSEPGGPFRESEMDRIMLTIPVYQPRRRAGRRGDDRPGRFRRRGQQAAAARRGADAPGGPPGRHGQHPRPGRRRRLGQEAVPPEGNRQRPRRLQADQQAQRRRRRPSPAATATTATPCPRRRSGPRSGWPCSPSFRTARPWSLDGLTLTKPQDQGGRQGSCGRSAGPT